MQEIITTKICTKCKIEKHLYEFNKSKKSKLGIRPQCKNCEKLYASINKEKIAQRMHKYRLKNIEKLTAYQVEYRIANRDNILKYRHKNRENKIKYQRQYYQENKANLLEYQHIYHQVNKQAVSNRIKKYQKTPKGIAVVKNSKYRRRNKTKQGDVTNDQLLQLQQNAKVCYWCNKPLKNKVIHIDHYVPLARGGEHTLSNLVVSCQSCNNKKHAKDPIDFAQSIGKLF